ncbi:RluA family pseudouridine synthase [Planctomicrobium piriforme]|uniref:Pseudouridine synthase n=1 Tax=Planctomicrobium piriforme TaxID=1576369 RepID=A0A1I3HR95_9PLAN|nr:RluA family pseudouridine synthase [Planctomicrobium piriforme]SFI38201.1 23S rRNA pseudouridine1911/1915/1917 synthase [Planctomicrobium piriforme]
MSEELSPESQSLTVEARGHGWRVDHYLTRIFPNHSRGLFQRAIEQQGVLVNGLPVKASRRLRVNDRISVSLPKEADSSIAAEDLSIEVLFEDDHLAVINKPANMVTHPGKANYTGTLAAAVQFHFDRLSDMAGQLRPGIVHRLDRDTTGVIIIAKDNQVHHRLTKQFELREVEKEYRAIVRGVLDRESDYIRTHVKVHPKAHEKMIVCAPEEKSREAVTMYHVLTRFRGFTEVQLLPETGRTHQLRVHMQHLKHPIIADRLYAGHDRVLESDLSGQPGPPDEVPLIARQALHAYRIKLRHPVSDAVMEFKAPFPEDFQRTLQALHTYRSLG